MVDSKDDRLRVEFKPQTEEERRDLGQHARAAAEGNVPTVRTIPEMMALLRQRQAEKGR